VKIEGGPIGLLDEREYDEITVKTEPGDIVLLYSDGIQDQQNPAGEEYGNARLFKALEANCRQTPKQIVDAIFVDIDSWMAGGPMTDDQTMIALKVT
jgi:sigma-B regulation protein RsbU (phosphoserine phosphatase)